MGIFNWSPDTPVHEAVGEAMGYASMCWFPTPHGVFDSEKASQATDELIEFLRAKQIGLAV